MWKPKYFHTTTTVIARNANRRIGQDEDRLGSERAEKRRRDPGVAVEHEAPDEPGGDLGEDIRQEENQAEEGVGRGLLIDEQSQQQRDRHLDEERHRQNDEGVAHGLPEDGVVEDLFEVGQADEVGRRAIAVPLEQTIVAGVDERQRDEQGEKDQRRRQHDEDCAEGVPALAAPTGRRQASRQDWTRQFGRSSRFSWFPVKGAGRRIRPAGTTVQRCAQDFWMVSAACLGEMAPWARSAAASFTTAPTSEPKAWSRNNWW